MIRMGRSSKNENTSANETAEHYEQSTQGAAFPFASANSSRGQGALSESETMARDIKEGRLSGFVGAGTVLTGETNFKSMLRIDGHVTGRVSSEEGTLIIGSTGKVEANVDVAAAVINGEVNGDIYASEKLELGRSARVTGNIKAPRLIIEDGAILEGNCSMIESKENFDQRLIEQQQQYQTSANDLQYDAEDSTSEYETAEDAELYDEEEPEETAGAAAI